MLGAAFAPLLAPKQGVFDLALLQPDIRAALWPVDLTHIPDRRPRLIGHSFGTILGAVLESRGLRAPAGRCPGTPSGI